MKAAEAVCSAWRSWLAKPAGKKAVDMGPATIILVLAVYTGLYFSMNESWKAGESWFALGALWAASLAVAEIGSWVMFPRAPAMVLVGLCLAQIPNSATLHLPSNWVSTIRAMALAIALLRGGLELEFATIWRLKGPACAYMLVPLIAVIAVITGVAYALSGMPIMLGISFGFIMNAVSPGIIVAQMLGLVSQGYGITNDVSIVAMLASIMDEVANLTGFAIFSNIALPSGNDPLAWTILKGPTEVLVGAAAGAVLGVVCGFTKIWNTTAKRCLAVFVSGGAIGALVVGLIAPLMWDNGWPRMLSQGPRSHYAHTVEHVTGILWNCIFEPLLFGTIAYDVMFSQISASVVALAIGFIFIAQAVRFTFAGGVMGALGYSWKESCFFAVAWLPKGTVQAALVATPLNLAHQLTTGNAAQHIEWGKLIKASAALSVAIFATVGTLGIEKLAPVLLQREKTMAEQIEEELDIIEGGGDDEVVANTHDDVCPAAIDKDVSAGNKRQLVKRGSAIDRATVAGLSQSSLSVLFRATTMRNMRHGSVFGDRASFLAHIPANIDEEASPQAVDGDSVVTAAVVPDTEAHLRSSDSLADQLLQHPQLLREYFSTAHELVALLAVHADVSHQIPGATGLAGKLQKLEKALYTPEPADARQLMRTMNDLQEVRAIRRQIVTTYIPTETRHVGRKQRSSTMPTYRCTELV